MLIRLLPGNQGLVVKSSDAAEFNALAIGFGGDFVQLSEDVVDPGLGGDLSLLEGDLFVLGEGLGASSLFLQTTGISILK